MVGFVSQVQIKLDTASLHPAIQQAYSLDHRVFSGDVNGARSNNWTILIGDHGKKRTAGGGDYKQERKVQAHKYYYRES